MYFNYLNIENQIDFEEMGSFINDGINTLADVFSIHPSHMKFIN